MIEYFENKARQLIKSSELKVALGNFVYRFLPKHGRIALASYPRSGNTWMRVLLESATGQLTGSIYKNDGINSRESHGVVIKTHAKDSFRYNKAVVLVRNPFDSIDSYFALKRNYFNDSEIEWEDHVHQAVIDLRQHTLHWKQASCRVLFLRYEDLKTEPSARLREVCDFIGAEVSDESLTTAVEEASIDSIRANSPDKGKAVIRRGVVGKGIESFSESQREMVKSQLCDVLAEFDYF